MPDLDLTQEEADALLAMEKYCRVTESYRLPDLGGNLAVPLSSADRREEFSLDVGRGRINLIKGRNQMRVRQVIVLARLDFGGAPHQNPDGERLECPHLHLYQEGFSDKWAFPVPMDRFSNLNDIWLTLHDFMNYCNVVETPKFERGLFS